MLRKIKLKVKKYAEQKRNFLSRMLAFIDICSHEMNKIFIFSYLFDVFDVFPSCFNNSVEWLNGPEDISIIFALNSDFIETVWKPIKKCSEVIFCNFLNFICWFTFIKSRITENLLGCRVKRYAFYRTRRINKINQTVVFVMWFSTSAVRALFIVLLNFLFTFFTYLEEYLIFVDFHQINAKLWLLDT